MAAGMPETWTGADDARPAARTGGTGTYQVALVGGGLQLLVDPDLRLVAVALKHLQLVALLEAHSAHGGALEEGRTPLQQLQHTHTPTRDVLVHIETS